MSFGTFAIMAIMVYATINRLEPKYIESIRFEQNLTSNSTNFNLIDNNIVMEIKLKIATTLCFCCGTIQVHL